MEPACRQTGISFSIEEILRLWKSKFRMTINYEQILQSFLFQNDIKETNYSTLIFFRSSSR